MPYTLEIYTPVPDRWPAWQWRAISEHDDVVAAGVALAAFATARIERIDARVGWPAPTLSDLKRTNYTPASSAVGVQQLHALAAPGELVGLDLAVAHEAKRGDVMAVAVKHYEPEGTARTGFLGWEVEIYRTEKGVVFDANFYAPFAVAADRRVCCLAVSYDAALEAAEAFVSMIELAFSQKTIPTVEFLDWLRAHASLRGQ